MGVIYAAFQKPSYTATTTFVLEGSETGGGLSQYSGLASLVGIDIASHGGGIFQGDNILELYKSRRMLEKTLLTSVLVGGKYQTLMERYIEFNKLRIMWTDRPLLQRLRFVERPARRSSTSEVRSDEEQRLKDSVLGKAVEDISKNYLNVTKPDKKLSIIKVDIKSTDEEFAKTFNEELVRNVNEFYIQTRTRKSLNNIAILQGKADSVRAIMNRSIYSAAAVVDATPNMNPTKQRQRNVPLQRAQFSAEANKAILSNLVQSLELAKISLLKETPLIQMVDAPVYPLKREKFGKLKGLILGTIFLSCLTCFFFLVKRLYVLTMNE
ncbi:lipopolysaccharide biosynthesis protein [Arcticibacter sp. MXS-1]|uniref:lipopolysaccharide biosynthesis protein n=1 Tax=Arcticibacter sp. MXS-1 TaxID=3341726 RepID=UPI0035A85ECD